MQASVAVAEALDYGKLTRPPAADVADFAVAALAVGVAALAGGASFVLVSFDARAQEGRLRRIIDLGPSMRGPRLLLASFAGLLAAAEMLRLPFLRGAMWPPRRHVVACLAYPLVAHGIAEPGLLACALLLLRASVGRGGARLPAAALALPLACLPFLTAHVLVLATPAAVAAYPGQLAHAADCVGHCAYPAYAATLLLALAAVYVPLLASACWDVAAVAINRRVRARACALAGFIIVPLPMQVVALSLTSVWDTSRYTSPTIGLFGFLAVGTSAAAMLTVLVLLPVYDALTLVEPQHTVAVAVEDDTPDEAGR